MAATRHIPRQQTKYIGPPYRTAEMYVGCVTCCPLVSQGEYADGTDRRTDASRYVTLRFLLNAASVITNDCPSVCLSVRLSMPLDQTRCVLKLGLWLSNTNKNPMLEVKSFSLHNSETV